MACRKWLLLVVLLLSTTGGPSDPDHLCGLNMYQLGNLCCKLCPTGHYVSKHCIVNNSLSKCSPCEPNTFMAHASDRLSCDKCNQCREDQEMVAECSPTSDRQCQCKSGRFCDSADCVESCFRCRRCPEGSKVLWPCNATANTVCAEPEPEADPESGNRKLYYLFFLVIPILIGIAIYCCKKKGISWITKRIKQESYKPGGPSAGNSRPHEPLLTLHAVRDQSAPCTEVLLGEESSAVAPEAETCPGSSEDLAENPVRQALVTEGGAAAPELALHPRPAALGSQGHTKATAPLNVLEQEYAKTYFLKDTSTEATNRIFYEIGHEIPKGTWKMFMRFIGLEENDIEICEDENPGNVMEQRQRMLLRWRTILGKDSSVFKLMAALHKLQLDMPLQNIINRLVAENILGRHAGTPT
ncbi:tumor necrosis factor receptor superfamily member 10B-like isoform X2 [Otolemur garnettii]|uniref:tumor necrosis factor receptor superfamily member 10B-like isoform X2 n=1 Tax=Otolemur garnettii TaxID=30611 RepID=UPI000C7F1F3F|nr:tumor necrosis factor receptor superfamily member 10B-like isoform X2 [Otolemur garnettii]